jgi:pSer/pThr/pTyr-binding forkhead associated (FHA) protein
MEATQLSGEDEMPTLKFEDKSLGEHKFKKGASVTIGRHQDNDVTINDPAVSGHHARIESVGNRLVLIDLKSKNGTFVNEQLVGTHWIEHGDIVTIGGHSLVLNDPAGEIRPPVEPDEFNETLQMNSTQHRRMLARSNPNKSINLVKFWDQSQNRGKIRDLEPGADEPGKKVQTADGVVTYLSGGSGQVALCSRITTIGKDPSSDIVVKGMLVDPTTATIRKEPGGYSLNYVSGLAKPKVNEKIVRESILLKDLDIIEVGSVKLQFSGAGAPDE